MTKHTSKRLRSVLAITVASLFTSVVLLPIAWVVQRAFVEHGAWSLQSYERLFAAGFSRAMLLSFAVSVVATVIGVTFAAGAAFAMARYQFVGKRQGLAFLLFSQLFPGVLTSVPLFFILDALGLLGSLVGVVLVYSSVSVPFSVWMLLGYFEQLPKELDEAGASRRCHAMAVFHTRTPAAHPAGFSSDCALRVHECVERIRPCCDLPC